jgi:hypothetical protein
MLFFGVAFLIIITYLFYVRYPCNRKKAMAEGVEEKQVSSVRLPEYARRRCRNCGARRVGVRTVIFKR